MRMLVLLLSLWAVVSLGKVTLLPTSCATSKVVTHSISTVDSIVTLNIDSQISEFDQIIMMPPTGKDLVIETTIYSDSQTDVANLYVKNSTFYTTHYVTIGVTPSSSTNGATNGNGGTSGNGAPTNGATTFASASSKMPTSSVATLMMSAVLGLALMLRTKPSILIILFICWMCVGVWAACFTRVVVRVSAPPTVQAICFKGACYCNCVAKGCGVNIHFLGSTATRGVYNTLQQSGSSTVRRDLTWGSVEPKGKGIYDFSAYDDLTTNLTSRDMVPYYILDYGNSNYDGGMSPYTDTSRTAFANYATNSTVRYKGNNIIWEMWNEPNIGFWKPAPNVTDYIALAKVTGEAIKAITPREIYVGPTVAPETGVFVEACLTSGLLSLWDAVSLHPYSGSRPELSYALYEKTRRVIRMNKPASKPYIPILSGEWGYTTVNLSVNDGRKVTEEQQAQYIIRQFISNLMYDVPVSIWYDFVNDGTNPSESEHNFGLFYSGVQPGDFAYLPKPSGQASITFFKFLRNLSFNKRLETSNSTQFVTLFTDGDSPSKIVIVAWAAFDPATVSIPSSDGTFTVTNMYGNQTETITAKDSSLTFSVSKSPVFIEIPLPNPILSFICGIKRLPLEIVGYGLVGVPIAVTNTFTNSRDIGLGADIVSVAPGQTAFFSQPVFHDIQNLSPLKRTYDISITGVGFFSMSTVTTYDTPIVFIPTLRTTTLVPFQIYNPFGLGTFTGTLVVSTDMGNVTVPVSVTKATTFQTVNVNLPAVNVSNSYALDYKVFDSKNVLASSVNSYFKISDDFSAYSSFPTSKFNTYSDGMANVTVNWNVTVANPPTGAAPGDIASMKVEYDITPGYKYFVVALKQRLLIPGNFSSAGMWIYGDGNGNVYRVRFSDASNQVFQITFPTVDWIGWRYVTGVAKSGSFFGGANDGIIHYPAYWDSYFLLDSSKAGSTGIIYFTPPVAVISTSTIN